MVTLTESASSKIQELMSKEGLDGHGLRLFITSGGCSGFNYGMDFENEAREGDQVYESYGVKVFVDAYSSQHVEGAKIDYLDSLQGSGFSISNPNAKRSCGCGQSFSTEDGAAAKGRSCGC